MTLSTIIKHSIGGGVAFIGLSFAVAGAVVQPAQAVPTFTTSGCVSPTACTMAELFSGGSFTIFDTGTPSAFV